ncbi:MAG: hypothetical protein HQM02_09205 [Magnetococcales bacterium]|nr:hypothetical protein [Magnetococcales bacterium]
MMNDSTFRKPLAVGRKGLPLLLLAVSLLAGCGGAQVKSAEEPDTPEIVQLLANKPEALQPLYRKLAREGGRNAVLNYQQIGVAALESGHKELAGEAFDQAISQINSIYAGTESAAKARSLWFEEGAKDFKGEPYERAMTFYYRGLIYLMNGDLENARASFKAAIEQDAFVEEDQYGSDFALMYLLSGWASQKLGNEEFAREAFDQLLKLRPNFKLPPPDHNVLIIVETGNAPRKLSDGMGHYQMKFRPGKHFVEQGARLQVKGQTLAAFPMEDIFYQANTRGARAVDVILKGKAVFRQTTADVGNAMSQVAANAMVAAPLFDGGGSHVQSISAGLGLVGAVTSMAAISSRPEADTRYWKNLPDKVHLATLHLEPAAGVMVQGEFLDERNQVRPELARSAPIHFVNGHGVAWLRSRSALQRGDAWHNVFE